MSVDPQGCVSEESLVTFGMLMDRHGDPEPSKDTPTIHRLILRSLRSY